ncbi:MAG: GNAT family N-acetyltransferase [Vicinamibacterales bacterium]
MSAIVVRCGRTHELTAAQLASARALMDAAFDGDFSDDDWAHALGGWHAIIEDGDAVIAHAAVVPRTLTIGARVVRVGYVEAVAVTPASNAAGSGPP